MHTMILVAHQAILVLTRRLRAALDEAETAYRLAPLALPTTMWRALAYSFLGRDEDALRDAAIGRSLGAPEDAGGLESILASAAERQGRYADASAHLIPVLPPAARAAGAAAITSAYEAAVNPAKRPAAAAAPIGTSWGVIWFPSMRPFRQDPRFQAFAERLNLVEYWQVYGPPDGCALDAGKIVCH